MAVRNYLTTPTKVLPGSGGTISGTAVSYWLDENGVSKYAPKPDVETDGDGATEPVDRNRC